MALSDDARRKRDEIRAAERAAQSKALEKIPKPRKKT